ncbi:hypothetical protein GCM10011360_06380 [Primorskyibacter flagellatus]|uniref:Uncharacterized protein n=1 Tax=Primorskyibacter flagellatus TaxID=1387277 RepID=A0A917A1N3_9RHOB|nr:hypothetical protein [Primorskyibacter flagellatus]GGE20416.1 hypothetical protein GCM10011360_06380 [Primorskyibacter flagellatus]
MTDRRPLFLERSSYRQRRLGDAARMLPVFGGVLMMLPAIWQRGEAEGAPATSSAMIYVFGGWVALSVAAFVLARWLDPSVTEPSGDAAGSTRGR